MIMDIRMLQEDLKLMPERDFFMKHIVKSQNWYISEYLKVPVESLIDHLDTLKEIVSKNFEIGFHSLQIVGSAKTGFSLSPIKIFTPFHDASDEIPASDIDIALVSDRLYHYWWGEIRKNRRIYYPEYQFVLEALSKSVFKGFINEKDICKLPEFRIEWHKIADSTNRELQDSLGFVHPISYRIYRSWEDLEEYQLYSIKKAKKQQERGK